jgi:hypothetical protein
VQQQNKNTMKATKLILTGLVVVLLASSCGFSTYPEVCASYNFNHGTTKGAKSQLKYTRYKHN